VSLEATLARIADALEAIEEHLRISTLTAIVDRERDAVNVAVEEGPHEWVEASKSFEHVATRSLVKGDSTGGRRDRRGVPLRCGRCRREGRSRMNHSNRCVECEHEEWWDE
jgi:hypothetical protein